MKPTVPSFSQLRIACWGTAAEAEDILQDAWLRVQDQAWETIEKPKQYLSTIVTRLCLNQLNSAKLQREQYLGPWLPEPIPTSERPELVNPLDKAIVHDSISIAFLVLLESLRPAERAVFLLHEVFDYKHREIAEMLEKAMQLAANCCVVPKSTLQKNALALRLHPFSMSVFCNTLSR